MQFERNNRSQKDRDELTRKRSLQFEALETRLMLHGSDEPEQHGDPDHDLSAHVHHHVSIFLEGESVEIPEDLGVHPVNGIIAEVHTHGDNNVLHVHPIGPTRDPLADYTPVSEVFKVWSDPVLSGTPDPNLDAVFGEEIDPDTGHRIRRLMDRVVDLDDPNETHTIRFLVNGVNQPQFDQYLMHDGDQIVISYEQKVQPGFPRLNPMANLTMAGGQTFHVPLAARDPEFGSISYDVSVSDPQVTAEIISGGNSVILTVSAVDAAGIEFTGTITIRLFETLAPDTAARFIELVEQGFYDGLSFHRIIDGFMAQFGSPSGDGKGGSGELIPDEYDASLTFNGFAQLALAKRTDNTGDSQAFITDTNLSLNMGSSPGELPPHFLNFNHTIFGQVVDGFRTLNRIIGTPVRSVNPSDPDAEVSIPIAPVVIDAARYYPDTNTGVLRLTAEPGFVGKVDVVVTAEDVEGKTFSRSFVMDVIEPPHDSNPFLDRLDPIHTTMGTPVSVPLSPVDIDGDPIEVNVYLDGTESQLESVTITPSVVTPDGVTGSATLNITPRAGFVGTTSFWLGVHRDEFLNNDGQPVDFTPSPFSENHHSFADFQMVEVVVDPLIAPPAGIDLLPPSDTGSSSIDNVTSRNNSTDSTLAVAVAGVEQGALVKLFADGTLVGEATATTASVIITTDGTQTLSDGSHTLTATQTVDGFESNPTPTGLEIHVDASPPVFTSASTFDVAADVEFQTDIDTDDETDLGGVKYTLVGAPQGMTIDSDSGEIRWTPGAAQQGENTATVRATDGAGNESEVMLTFNVSQAPPGSIDLLSVSDTGASSSDNVTRLNNSGGQTLRFEVEGVAAEALVRLFADGLLIGQGTAAGDSIIITTNGSTALPDGSHTITATQTVGGSESGPTPVGLTIVVDASPPNFTSSSVFNAAVGVDSHTDVDTDDELGLGVQYTLIGAPQGMTIESGDGEIHWTPGPGQVGMHTATIRATDLAGNESTQSLAVNVAPPPPTGVDLLAASDTGQSSTDDVTGVNNTGGQGLRLEVQGVTDGALVRVFADGLRIGQATAAGESVIITTDGTTAVPDGVRNVTATQSVDGLTGGHSPPLEITVDTLQPVFTSTPDLSVLIGESYAYDADTDDEFTSGVSYSLLERPDGMTIDAQSGEIQWTPASTQNGSHPVVIRAVDRVGNERTQSFTLDVDVNEAPVIEAIAPISTPEEELVSLLVEADDPNLPNDQLSWSLEPGAPAGMAIDPSTGRVSWIPGEADGPGTYDVTVRATDQGGLFDVQTVSIAVTEVNRPPVLDPIPDQTLTSGETLRLAAAASDADLPVQAVRYSVDSDAPGTLSMDSVSGEFSWTAPSNVTGRFDFTIHAEDTESPRLTNSQSFSVAVSGGVDDVSFGVALAERSRQILDGLPRRATNLLVPPLPGFVLSEASAAGVEVSVPVEGSGPRPLITTGAGGGTAPRAKATSEMGDGEQNQGPQEDAPPAEGEEQPENGADPRRGRLEDRDGQQDPRETVELSPEAVDRILAELAGALAP